MSDVFSSDKEPETTADKPQAPTQLEMIGDGKKYADVSAADKALNHSQSHISHIENENEVLRKELEATKAKLTEAKTVDDVLAKLQTVDDSDMEKPSIDHAQHKVNTLNEADVQSMVNDMLARKQADDIATSNRFDAVQQLSEKYGDKTSEVIAMKQKELGIDLGKLAEVSPKAAVELFATVKDVPVQTTQNSIRSDSMIDAKIATVKDDPRYKIAVEKGDARTLRELYEHYGV